MTTYKWVRTNLNNNVYKYYFTNSSQERLSWKDVLELLEDKDQNFFPVFQLALSDANNRSSPYRWNCSPVSKMGLEKSFEFVVKKESSLQNNSQNYTNFQTYINNSSNPYACSFKNLGKDATLIIPMPVSGKNFSSISYFTQNATLEQQEKFWQQVAIKLIKETNRDGKTRWLNTQGLGEAYLHVRIDSSPKYYFFEDYKNPNYTPIPTPRTPREKILANLDKICLDPLGYLANADLLKNDKTVLLYNKGICGSDKPQWKEWEKNGFKVEIEGEVIDLKPLTHSTQIRNELVKALINEIERNKNDWEIIEPVKGSDSEKVVQHKSGRRHWKSVKHQEEWGKIKDLLKSNAPNKKDNQELKNWHNPLDYPLPWTIAVAFSALLIVTTINFWKKTKKKF